MYRPAGYSDSDDSDYDGLDVGGDRRVTQRYAEVVPAAPTAESLRKDRDTNIIDIIAKGRLDDLDELCSNRDFNVDEPLLDNWSPLIHACQNAQYNAVDILLAANADPNKLCNGTVPLMEACATPTDPKIIQDIVALLLHKDASPNVRNRFGRTPLMYACMNGNLPVVTQLLQLSNLSACDNDGNTALFYAIEYKHFDITKLLLEQGASREIRNNFGSNARDWAIDVGFDRIEELIPTVVQYMVPNELSDYKIPADFAPTALQSDKPAFFPDIINMLRSLRCDSLLENFVTSKISLMEFLILTDARLKEVGVVHPFQRNRIMYGLYKFHLSPWSPLSVEIMKENDTTFDLFFILAGSLKQMLIIECTFNYVSRSGFRHSKITEELIERIADCLQQITLILPSIRDKTEKIHQQAVHPALLIPRKSSVGLKTILKYSTVLAVCGLCYKLL